MVGIDLTIGTQAKSWVSDSAAEANLCVCS